MNWLSFARAAADGGVRDPRFVPDGPVPVSAAPVPASRSGPACLLVTNDARLADACAHIAVGAAVHITRCGQPEQVPALSAGPVLWGADMDPQLRPDAPCDVLVGLADQAPRLWALAGRLPQTRVAILPEAAGWLGEYLGLHGLRSGPGYTLALGGVAGGVGTSTLAALLAQAGTLRGLRSLLVDLDPHSAGLWPRLGCDPPAGVGWAELAASGGQLAGHQLAEALPELCGTRVLTWAGGVDGITVGEQLACRVLSAARHGFDLLVVDTGRAPHPQAGAIEHCVDRTVAVPHGLARSGRISAAVQRGCLFDALRSRRVRQQLADLCLLPDVEAAA